MACQSNLLLILTLAWTTPINIAVAGSKICSVIQDEKTKLLKIVDGDQKPFVAQAAFTDESFNKTGFVMQRTVSSCFATITLISERDILPHSSFKMLAEC